MTTALPHYARDSRAFFPPSPLLTDAPQIEGRARKTIELLRRPRSTEIFPHVSILGRKIEETGLRFSGSHSCISKRLELEREFRFNHWYLVLFFFFFLIQKSNFNQIFLPIIDQCHRKILAVHRLYPPPPSSPAKRISATPHRKQNNRASTKPQFDRFASWSVNRATIFVLARNPCSGEGGERSVILIAASFYHPTKSNAQQWSNWSIDWTNRC